MKSILLLFCLSCSAAALNAQTLFTYGNHAVDKQEFLRAYEKNKSVTDSKAQAVKEYVDLYLKFKLKVQAAKDLRLDTMPQLKSEIQSFRAQIEENYMSNDKAVNELVNEAVAHAEKDLHVIHFFTALNTNTPDSAKAVNDIQQAYADLSDSRIVYKNVLTDIPQKFSSIKASDIGYITAFTLPYEFEKIIYALKAGSVSQPYRSKKGLHLFKVLDERSNPGKWKIAQILLAVPPGNEPSGSILLQQKADSIYLQLNTGADFADMAKKYSDDKLTYLSGGQLTEFTTGRYQSDFENQVFKLVKDGEISKPFLTEYGFHIVKRLSVKPLPAYKNDAAFLYEIKQKVQEDYRINTAKELFTKSILKSVLYKRNITVKDAELFRYADSVALNPFNYQNKRFPVNNKAIYSFAKNILTGKDWLQFVATYKTNTDLNKPETNAVLLEKFVTAKSVEYYKNHLEYYNPEFRNQMEEFKEGNLLFEVMERKVWSSAANDNNGLKKYYQQHQDKYAWATSADVLIFSCTNKKRAEESLTALQGGKDWKIIARQDPSAVQIDSGRYELSQIALPEGAVPLEGMITPIVVNATDSTAGFVKIIKIHPANEQRSFEEARGLVINDYQNLLEEKWILELKRKYPVKINEKVLETLVK
jgi:peptidyl-prolyl cis-trans isomerase SurA